MSKSVSIPLSLSDLRGGSTRLPQRKSPSTTLSSSNYTFRSLDGFILSIVEKDGRCTVYGSAADSAGISIGDEVVAVNGRNVEGRTHDQLVKTIQDCIRSRNVSLRVRRLHSDNIGDQLLSKAAILREAILVSVNNSERQGIIDKINQSYPGISTFDMEELANGGSHLQPTVHTSCNGSTNEEQTRIKRYDDDIRERKERQFQRQKENELLRSSLRASKKLKALTINENNNSTNNSGMTRGEDVIETSLDEVDALQGIKEDRSGYENESFVVSDSSCREVMDDSVETPDEQPNLDQIILSVERIAEHLNSSEGRPEEGRLIRDFFTSPPVKSAIQASSHHSPIECSSRIPHEEIGPSSNLRIVTLYKDNDNYLGATVRNEEHRMVVGRVVAGGIAERTGLLQEGDELLEVNGLELRGRNVGQVCDVLRGLRGEIRLVINTDGRKARNRLENVKKLRSLFNYDPHDDVFVPCRELALSFSRGDVLHILDTSDSNWWQATLDGSNCRDQLAGIIPSPSFRQQVLLYQQEDESRPKSRKEAKKIIPDIMNTMKRKQKELMIRDENGPMLTMDSSYEEVSLHLARSSHKRALVLCSPEGAGSLQLRQSLLEKEEDRLAAPIPYTSRSPKEGEVDGIHYHFVSRSKLIEMGKTGQLVEFGEFEKNLYGTALADIISVREKGKTCLLTLKPQSLWSIRTSQVMPYIVFISPPSAVQLRRQKEIMGERNVTDDTLRNILSQGKTIQQQFGHLFDATIVNTEMSRSLEELRSIVNRLETEPFWIPSTWLHQTASH
ncbi:magu-2 [Pristionchus pacificus]|nr:magu-2 [Pristionchus pacificus]